MILSSPLPHYLLWKAGLAQPTTQTTPAERSYLASVASGKQTIVEIGVWHGVTTCELRRAMHPDGTLYAVDPYPTGRLGVSLHESIARKNVNAVENGRVTWVRKTGDDAARSLGHLHPDLVFVDGDHSYHVSNKDWQGWSALMPVGGVIALHDTHIKGHDGSSKLALEIAASDDRFRIAAEVDSITSFVRV